MTLGQVIAAYTRHPAVGAYLTLVAASAVVAALLRSPSTSSLIDHLAGTYYPRASEVPRSPTTFDLGYTAAERIRYPWLAERSEPGDLGR
jgi:hypothetical protein